MAKESKDSKKTTHLTKNLGKSQSCFLNKKGQPRVTKTKRAQILELSDKDFKSATQKMN